MKKTDSSLPLYLGGHSSGAGLVLNYLSHQADDKINGYIFLSPYLGYKSDTDRQGSLSFSKVDVSAFVVNGMSLGLLCGHAPAVRFNYPPAVLAAEPLLIPSITVNMSLATTPSAPFAQFKGTRKPYALFVGAEDELLDASKVLSYASLPDASIVAASSFKLVEGANHLSILLVADRLIGEAIASLVGASP